MANLYFNGAVDADWNTLGNWWTNDTFTTQATSLPSSSDSIIVVSQLSDNTGFEAPTVVNLTVNDSSVGIEITTTGVATFNNSTLDQFGQINGNAIFNNSINNSDNGITGTATFNNGSNNNGNASNCIFNDTSDLGENSDISGNATFTRSSFVNDFYPINISGNIIFTSTIPLIFTFNGTEFNGSQWIYPNSTLFIFNNSSSCSFLNGPPNNGTFIFNDTSSAGINQGGGYIRNAIFYDNSFCEVVMYGRNTFYDNSYISTLAGAPNEEAIITFKDRSYNQMGITGSVTVNYGPGINDSDILGLP
jgi:hypothetical protein